MLELRRVRAIVAEITAEVPPDAPLPAVEEVGRALDELVAAGGDELRYFGVARDGTALRALTVTPHDAPDAPGVALIGVPRGDAPTGAAAVLSLARRLCADRALVGELGVRWWLVPCLDPTGARENASWWRAPLALDAYAREVVVAPPDLLPDAADDTPEWTALRRLLMLARPRAALFFYDAPTGGFALRAGGGTGDADWDRRTGDFGRLLDPLGLPFDLRDALAPDNAGNPYARFWREHLAPVGATLPDIGQPGVAVVSVVSPLFADYARRERDRTRVGAPRRAVVAEGIQLWREWFAFGRTALDLVAPLVPAGALAGSADYRALLSALRGADAILAGGLGWPALVAEPDHPATVAEAFAQGDAIRLARLPRLATLIRALAAVQDLFAPTPPDILADTLDRARDMQARWIDELAAPRTLRPLRRDRVIAAQVAGVSLALP